MTPRDDDRTKVQEDLPVSGNLFALIVGLVSVGLLAISLWASGLTDDQADDALTLSHCAAIAEDSARLACFDKLAAPRQPARGALAILHNHQDEKTP